MTTTADTIPALHEAQFSTGDLAKAAGVTSAALQTWIRRGLIVGTGEGVDMPGKSGIRRVFTFGNLMEIATGAALIRRGVSPRDAFRAAAKFAHSGINGRHPGLPFPEGRTLICVDGERSAVIQYGPATNLCTVFGTPTGADDGLTLVWASQVFDRAVSTLGWHPEAVLEASYGEASQ